VFLEAARKRSNDPRFGFQHPDAQALPFADGSFDRAFSMLVLSFITDIEHAVAEMRCVVRPGRTGDCSSMGPVRRNAGFSVVAGHRSRARSNRRTAARPVLVADRARRDERNVPPAGLVQVEQISLTIRMDFTGFDDYWRPLQSRDGPTGLYLAALSDEARATLWEHVWRDFLCNRPEGPRSFAATAWACQVEPRRPRARAVLRS